MIDAVNDGRLKSAPRMVFLQPFHDGDIECSKDWLQWVLDLGGAKTHSMILMPAKALRDDKRIKEMRELAEESFGDVAILPDAEGIVGHPQGPNSNMRQAIWHCQVNNIGPWTFIEPDCIPLVSGWADVWEREYRAFAKPFMGEFRPASGVTPDYLSGNMVLPRDALLVAPMLARRGLSIDGVELAFDIVAAKETLPNAHLTKLLNQVPKTADGGGFHFDDFNLLDTIRVGAVLFHPCKDGSLIEQLRINGRRQPVADNIPAQLSAAEPSDSQEPFEINEKNAVAFLSERCMRSGFDHRRIIKELKKAGVMK